MDEYTLADNRHMAGIPGSDAPAEVDDLELAAHMRVWHEDEDVARGMIAIEKLEAEKAAKIDADAALEASVKRLFRDLRDRSPGRDLDTPATPYAPVDGQVRPRPHASTRPGREAGSGGGAAVGRRATAR